MQYLCSTVFFSLYILLCIRISRICAFDILNVPGNITSTVSSNNFVVVGDEINSKIFVYKKSNDIVIWELISILHEGLGPSSKYGHSIDIDDVFIVVGAPGEQKVYLYEINVDNDQFELIRVFYPPISYLDGGFGNDVSIDNNRIAIAHPGKKVFTHYNLGCVELYYNLGYEWSRVQSLIPSDYTDDIFFGDSVQLRGDKVITSSSIQGRAYVFGFNTYTESWNEIKLSLIHI